MDQSANNIDYLIAFGSGILMSFTPCVYPLIPVSAGNIGARAGGSRAKGLVLSIVYVLGLAVTYSILGLVATLTGSIFGRVSSHPVTQIVVGCIVIFFGFSLLGFFHIHIPHKIKRPEHEHDYLYTFLLGLSSGLVISPCLSPALGAILAFLTTKQNLFYGATLLFSFALGMGLIFILIGAFEGLLMNLPKSGKWMINIKRISAIIVMIMGVYLIYKGIRRL